MYIYTAILIVCAATYYRGGGGGMAFNRNLCSDKRDRVTLIVIDLARSVPDELIIWYPYNAIASETLLL